MKCVKITTKGLREISRDRKGFFFLLIFPVIFIAVFSFAFGSGTFQAGGSLPHDIAVVNHDVGVKTTAKNTTKYVNYGVSLTRVLENATAENSSTKLFSLHNVSEEQANDMLRTRSIDALIVIPKNFSGAFTSIVNDSASTAIKSKVGAQTIASSTGGQNQAAIKNSSTRTSNQTSAPTQKLQTTAVLANSTSNAPLARVTLPKTSNVTSALSVEGDSGYVNFMTAQGLITEIFDHYRNDVAAKAVANAASGQSYRPLEDYIPVEMSPIAGTQLNSPFDYMVPGLIVVAILLQVSLVSGSLVRDIETGTLDRLKLSKATGGDLLSGTFLTWTLITIAQVPLLIAVATALGYHYPGGLDSLELAVVIGVIAGMASIALALLIASFAKNELQALELGAIIIIPVAFLAGAFFPLPKQVIGELAGRTYVIYDILPWTHAINALRSILTYGTGLSADVVVSIIWLIVSTAILFMVGVICYSKMRLRPEA
ncbi:MAG: ABC transporter permease [Halobacteriota archaeon]